MSVTNELLRNAERYAENFDKGELPLPPAKRVAIVACMDARLNVYGLFGLAGGRGPCRPQRRRSGDRRRDPVPGHLPAVARHPADHPGTPHRLRGC